jgi:UDP-N-acetylglucosamine 2-epimerase (non-hydrolysing)
VVFVAHPRTMISIERFGLRQQLENTSGLLLLPPEPYIRFMNLVTGAKVVITDSGGLQEETTYLSIPCLTLRENTERPVTVSMGTNRLATPVSLPGQLAAILEGRWPQGQCPELWDGRTAERAVACLHRRSHPD